MSKTRVLVVDDSALMRKLIPQMLSADPFIEVVGTAMDGNFCLKKIEELQPQVITLDLDMPGMNGIETLKQIMRRHPLPVIVVSSHSTEGAAITMKALALGAFDFIAKPRDAATHMDATALSLIAKIRAATDCKLVQPNALAMLPRAEKLSPANAAPDKLIAIGISTGGPQAMEFLLAQLPPDFPAALAIVQHMPEGFTSMFARRLNELSALHVKEAQSGDVVHAGEAIICPGNRHMRLKRLNRKDVVLLSDEETVNGHRPSVDVLFRSVAAEFGSEAVAVLMTGMGDDGAAGLGAVQKAGGMTIAQSEQSCVVYGMPKVAIERGFANRIVGLDGLAVTLQSLCRKPQSAALAARL